MENTLDVIPIESSGSLMQLVLLIVFCLFRAAPSVTYILLHRWFITQTHLGVTAWVLGNKPHCHVSVINYHSVLVSRAG